MEFIKEQHRFHDHSFTVEVEIPEETRAVIERRMQLLGEDPAENREKFIDYALEHVEVQFQADDEAGA